MIKKDILLNPIVRDMREVKEPPVTAFLDLGKINKDEANQHLSQRDKQRLVDRHKLLNPIVRDMREVKEPPVTAFLDLGKMNKDEANQHLSQRDKQRWVDVHNKQGNFYFINQRGDIQDVEPTGWWY